MPIMRVRRSSDGDEQDFTADEMSDGTLAAFCGAGDGFVVTWYDQSGNGRHATQATAARQPQVVASGVVLAAPTFDGTDDYLSVADPIIGAQWMSLCVFMVTDDEHLGGLWESVQTGSVNNRIVSFGDTRTDPKRMLNYAPDGTGRFVDLAAKLSPDTTYMETLTADGSTVTGYIDGALQNSIEQPAVALNMNTFHLGRQETGAFYHKGTLAELVIYPTVTNRETKEARAAARHGITLA